MRFPKALALTVAALLPVIAGTASTHAAPVQDTFNFILTGEATGNFGAGFSGQGTLTATDNGNGSFTVISATGDFTYHGNVLTGSVIGLGNLFGSDQLIFPTSSSLVDQHGFAVLLSDGQQVDISNAGAPAGFYTVESSNTNGTAILTIAAVPEPATWAMMILGFCGLGFMAYRKKTSVHFA